MPVNTEWNNAEKTVIIATIDWPWDWDALAAGWQTGVDMMNSVSPRPVYMIVVAKTSRFPVGNILSNLTHMTKIVPNNIGLAILVPENRFQETINQIFFKLSPGLRQKGRVVNSLDKALALVAVAERPLSYFYFGRFEVIPLTKLLMPLVKTIVTPRITKIKIATSQ